MPSPLRAFLLISLLAVSLVGCANRPPPEPIRPLAKVALIEPGGDATMTFLNRGGGVVTALFPIAGIALAAQMSANRDRLAERFREIDYTPLEAFRVHVKRELGALGVQTELLSTSDAAQARRSRDYRKLPGDAEAAIEVTLYTTNFMAPGFSFYKPSIYAAMWIARRSDGASLGSTGYSYGPLSAKGDPRYFEVPEDVGFDGVDTMIEKPQAVADSLDAGFRLIARRLAEDVKTRIDGKPIE